MSALDTEFAAILDGEAREEAITDFLARSLPLMSDPEALAAGARALRARMVKVAAPENAIDVCGTGGDGAHTLNISTAVAFVVAGCGIPVAKHGNRAMSSACGAADVLEALGVKLTGDVPTLETCLREANVAFLFAQHHHPAMRHVAAARRQFAKRTIFNLVGPLSNPAGVKRQLVGVFAPDYVQPMAEALRLLGAERAWVVHGAGGLDELANDNGNVVSELSAGAIAPRTLEFIGFDGPQAEDALRGGDALSNAAQLRALLEGRSENEPYRQIVTLNAAAALCAGAATEDLGEAAVLARESLEDGAALEALDALVALTRGAP